MNNTFTTNKDVDIDILNRLDDEDLVSFCSVDKYANSLCNDEEFWKRRVVTKYGKYLKPEVIQKYVTGKKWGNII